MKWGRFGAFLVLALCILGLTAGTSQNLWKHMKLGLDLRGGFDLVYRIVAPPGHTLTSGDKQAIFTAVQLRVNSSGMTSPTIQLEPPDRIDVQLAGTYSPAQANNVIGRTAQLTIYGNVLVKDKKTGKVIPWTQSDFYSVSAQPGVVVVPDPKSQPLLNGNQLNSDAHYAQDPQTGTNTVNVTMKSPGLWASITKQYNGKLIFTFLGTQLVNDAQVQGVNATGSVQITLPGYTVEQCTTLANQLNAGALPFPLQLISQSVIGPSLGAESLRTTLTAGLIAIILIFTFMLLIYRAAGLIANLALLAYIYVVLALFSGFGIVLTLPGLAALVLGIGMAVDANIISYERIKDEIRNGKSLQSSVIAGNRRALRTILDSNATTFIAGAVMYWFGEGDIRGFGISLMLSIVVSLVTAVFLSRVMVMQFTRARLVRNPFWFGIRKGAIQK